MSRILNWRYGLAALLAIMLTGVYWGHEPDQANPAYSTIAEFQIENMSCGACAKKIKQVISIHDGVGAVDISPAENTGQVVFNPSLTSPEEIEQLITSSGYPATLVRELPVNGNTSIPPTDELTNDGYIARIAGRLVSRDDFQAFFIRFGGPSLPPSEQLKLKQKAWQEMVKRHLLLAEAEDNKIDIQPEQVDMRIIEIQKRHPDLEQIVAAHYRSMADFRKQLKEDMMIDRNLEDYVFSGHDVGQRREQFRKWYTELNQKSEIVILDPEIRALSQAGHGCACCS